MTRPFSLAQLTCLPYSPPDLIGLAARAGYSHVGLRVTEVTAGGPYWPLHRDKALLQATLRAMADTGVGVFHVELFRISAGLDVRTFEGELAVAAELGARHVLTHGTDPDPGRRAETFAAFCDLAATYGLTCDVESVTWLEVGDFDAAVAMCRDAARANAGVMIDTLHFARGGGVASDIEGLPQEWFRYVQLADAPAALPATPEGFVHTAREARLAPGEGELDIVGILQRLPKLIPIGIEAPNTAQVTLLGYEGHARRVLEATKRLIAEHDL